MTNKNAIHIKNLNFGYKKNQPLLCIDEWQVSEHAQVFLYGASGSGKSTLLNLLSGILVPQSGGIWLLNQNFSALSAKKRDAFRAKNIGVVFQEFNLIPFLTVAENIQLATYFAGHSADKKDTSQTMTTIFERLQLSQKLLSQRADALSVGQRQRVSIARALINKPSILIADEPTSALDSDNRDEFMRLLLETTVDCTVLFVSHDKGLQSHFSHTQDIREFTH